MSLVAGQGDAVEEPDGHAEGQGVHHQPEQESHGAQRSDGRASESRLAAPDLLDHRVLGLGEVLGQLLRRGLEVARPPSGRAGGCGSAPARRRCRGPGRPGPARAGPRRAAPRRTRPAAPSRSAPRAARWMARWAAVNSAVVQSLSRRSEYAASARRTSSRSGSAASAQRRTPAVSITVRARHTSRTWTGSSRRTWVPLLGTRSARPSATRYAERLAHRGPGDAERVGERHLAQRRARRRARPRTASAAAPRPPGRPW